MPGKLCHVCIVNLPVGNVHDDFVLKHYVQTAFVCMMLWRKRSTLINTPAHSPHKPVVLALETKSHLTSGFNLLKRDVTYNTFVVTTAIPCKMVEDTKYCQMDGAEVDLEEGKIEERELLCLGQGSRASMQFKAMNITKNSLAVKVF